MVGRALNVEGAVQAEVLGLRLGGAGIELTGPCGAAPWYIQVGPADDPLSVAAAMVSSNLGEPLVVHSTSWRRERGAVLLTFAAALGPGQGDQGDRGETVPVRRVGLARSSATAPPPAISVAQVVEHALRHLAWLIADDPVVAARLGDPWARALGCYRPEPFRSLRGGKPWN